VKSVNGSFLKGVSIIAPYVWLDGENSVDI